MDIGSFICLFRLKHPEYGINLQNDTQEFLRVLLQDINIELNENKRNINYHQIYYNDQLSKKDLSKEYFNYFNKIENSIITKLFYSQIINKFTCECKYNSYSFDKITDILYVYQ